MGMLRDEVAVVGGGLVGKAAALALAQAGLDVRLCGARPAAALPETGCFAQRIYAVNAASRALLQGLRVWEQVPAERIQPVQRMHVRADGAELRFDAYAQGVESLAWIVESDAIERALDLALRFERGVQLLPDVVEHARRDAGGWELGLSGGASLRCALLVGADGRSSRVREWSSIGLRSKPYGQTAVVCNFSCGAPHGASALQTFTDDGGVLALLPLPTLQGRAQVSCGRRRTRWRNPCGSSIRGNLRSGCNPTWRSSARRNWRRWRPAAASAPGLWCCSARTIWPRKRWPCWAMPRMWCTRWPGMA